MNTLGGRIQELRKKAGLSQSELAKKINISHTQMGRYEIKDVQPPADVLKRLADLFGTSIDYLVLGNSDEKATQSLKDAELVADFKKVALLPEEERKTIIKVIKAYIRDFNTQQAYSL